jgi:AraC-like DNA-binding protein
MRNDDSHRIHPVTADGDCDGSDALIVVRASSPKAYLQAQRLMGVRRMLRATGAEVPISDIANEWGLWHMGQFAADYRRHFGELPSETIRGTSGVDRAHGFIRLAR